MPTGLVRFALGLAIPAGLLAGMAAPGTVLAGSATFGSPTATSRFLTGITFLQPVDLATRPKRVELVLEEPGFSGATVTEVAVPSATGHVQLRSVLETAQGQLLTNTTVSARWRLTFADGSVETGPATSVTYSDTRFAWRTMTGQIVRLHWYNGSDSFARQAIALGDGAIQKAAQLLGVTETQPVDFFVYADQQPFSDALGPGSHENVAGTAYPEIRTMFGLITPDELGTSEVSRVVEHELTHLVFDTATKNAYHSPLHWLNEGLAVYLSEGYAPTYRQAVADAVSSGTTMPLAALTGDFPASYDRFLLAYGESVSAVDLIVRTYGRDALVKLIRSYADGVSDDQAFSSALGLDTAAFDASWLKAVGSAQPARYGPQSPPPGPTPSDWTASGAEPAAGQSPDSAGSSTPGAVAGQAASPGPAIPAIPPGNGSGGDLATLLIPVGAVVVAIGLLGGLLAARRNRRRSPGGDLP